MGVIAPIKPATIEEAAPADAIHLEIFTSVPAWAFAYGVKDGSCMPLFRLGEVAVVQDKPGIIPDDGGLYIIEYESRDEWGKDLNPAPRPRRSHVMVQVNKRERRNGTVFWTCDPYARPRTEAQRLQLEQSRGVIICSDGPCPDQYTLAYKLLGKVVGIYSPDAIPAGRRNLASVHSA